MTNSAARKNVVLDVSKLVSEISGVQLGDRQRVMVETRLMKHIRELGMNTFEDYAEYLEGHREQETQALISLLTTHHTYFFREFSHFEAMEKTHLNEAIQAAKKRGDNIIRIWCAACSRGQEVYSLSMFVHFYLKQHAPTMRYEILGTDIDEQSVAHARNGVYLYNEIQEIPLHFIQGHWARGSGDIANYVKAKPTIKENCRFDVLNLMKAESWPDHGPHFDIIFCRNVYIYFNEQQIDRITRALLKRLQPEGTFFIGISESLNNLKLPLQMRGPSIYQHATAKAAPGKSSAPTPLRPTLAAAAPTPAPSASPAAPIRVLCVDDSSSILTLLKKILSSDKGFQIIGTAANGLDAAQKVKDLKPDLITLDIHMPEQNGIEYLQKNFNSSHPPVVIISSVSREDSNLALRGLELGASDYVEKPLLANLEERADEIRNKIQCAFRYRTETNKEKLALTQSFAKKLEVPASEAKLRVVVAGLSDRKKLENFLLDIKKGSPVPTVVLFEGCEGVLPALIKDFEGRTGLKIENLSLPLPTRVPLVSFGDFGKNLLALKKGTPERITSVILFGEVSDATVNKLAHWPRGHLIVEDLPFLRKSSRVLEIASDLCPPSSLAYMSDELLRKAHG